MGHPNQSTHPMGHLPMPIQLSTPLTKHGLLGLCHIPQVMAIQRPLPTLALHLHLYSPAPTILPVSANTDPSKLWQRFWFLYCLWHTLSGGYLKTWWITWHCGKINNTSFNSTNIQHRSIQCMLQNALMSYISASSRKLHNFTAVSILQLHAKSGVIQLLFLPCLFWQLWGKRRLL